jgi:ketosteroid isomerase-like protein
MGLQKPATDTSTAASVGALVDEAEIRRLLYDYCRAIDRCDAELLASVYHTDATEDHGEQYRGDIEGYVRFILDLLQRDFVMTTHSLGNILVSIDGDVAHSESYFSATHVHRPDDSGITLFTLIGGRYFDRFERRNGDWRIAAREALMDWSQQSEHQPAYAEGVFATGARDRTDLSYRRA